MSGYLYSESEPTQPCPYCATACQADFVDVGVGYTQCGPYHCQSCGASEIGPHDKDVALSARERECGWYAPGSEPGSSANVIGGQIVSHQEMRAAYRNQFAGNPAYEVPGAVEKWFEEIRNART